MPVAVQHRKSLGDSGKQCVLEHADPRKALAIDTDRLFDSGGIVGAQEHLKSDRQWRPDAGQQRQVHGGCAQSLQRMAERSDDADL
jgi:hypothetical protein